MGRRQIGELSAHEFVITILISAVATVPLEDNEIPLSNSLLPILMLMSLEIIQSVISLKSTKFRSIFEGNPIFIIKDGKLIQSEMRRLRLTINDIIDNLRQNKVFDISAVKNAVIEPDGKISVQEKSDNSPFPFPVVTDGKIISEYFGKYGIDEERIKRVLKKSNVESKELMLLTIDDDDNIYFIKKESK